MEYKKTMYLLSLLYPATEGENKERIGELFKQAVVATDEYQKLKKIIQSISFLGVDGKAILADSEDTLKKSISEITNTADNIKHLDFLLQQIENELNRSESLLFSPGFFEDDFAVVKTESIDLYNRFYRVLANCICYYLISHFGVKSIRNLTFNSLAGFQDMVRLVNRQYGNELAMSYQNKKPLMWNITKVFYTCDNYISYEGYRLEYTETPLSTLLKKAELYEYHRIAPFIFAALSPTEKTVFAGIGNIVGIDSINALSLLNSEIITSLPNYVFRDEFEPINLMYVIKHSLNTDCFCISPEELVSSLNRQSLSATVEKRRSENRCIICGKEIQGRVACIEHMSIGSQQV